MFKIQLLPVMSLLLLTVAVTAGADQISTPTPVKTRVDISMLKSGDYSAMGDETLSKSLKGDCYRHLEVDPTNDFITIQFRGPTGSCGDQSPVQVGSVSTYICQQGDQVAKEPGMANLGNDGLPIACIEQEFHFDDRGYSFAIAARIEILEPLSDGSFLVKTFHFTDSGSDSDQSDYCDVRHYGGCAFGSSYVQSKFLPYAGN